MKEKQALTDVTGHRYRKADKAGKTKILDEFCQSTGYHRKYAITVLRNAGKTQVRRIGNKPVKVIITAKPRRKRVYQRYYDGDVEQAILAIWEFFHFVCGKRLIPMIRDNLDRLAAHFGLTDVVRVKLATLSRATAERIFAGRRKQRKEKGTCSTRPGTLLKQQIPVRTFWRWDDKQPGFCEIDTVSHDGGSAFGEYAHTLSVTDVALCWSEFRALKNKACKWTQEALDDVRSSFPVPFKGIDSDNGAEFINWHLKDWCETHRINFTRGRQYRKNDNAYVEQKNGDIIRKTIGYGRFEGDDALSALARVYAVLNPLYNFFYPNLKCIDKLHIGQKTKRVYEQKPKTPFRRIMEQQDIPRNIKLRLSKQKAGMDIVTLQLALDSALDDLRRLMYQFPGSLG